MSPTASATALMTVINHMMPTQITGRLGGSRHCILKVFSYAFCCRRNPAQFGMWSSENNPEDIFSFLVLEYMLCCALLTMIIFDKMFPALSHFQMQCTCSPHSKCLTLLQGVCRQWWSRWEYVQAVGGPSAAPCFVWVAHPVFTTTDWHVPVKQSAKCYSGRSWENPTEFPSYYRHLNLLQHIEH